MSKLSRFIGLSKEVEIHGEKLKLFPLTLKEMGILDRMDTLGKKTEVGTELTKDEQEELAECGRGLIKAAYHEEEFTDEEIQKMDLDMYSELFAQIMENTYDMSKNGKGINRIGELKAKVISEGQQKSG
jgi:hypothetical protein